MNYIYVKKLKVQVCYQNHKIDIAHSKDFCNIRLTSTELKKFEALLKQLLKHV